MRDENLYGEVRTIYMMFEPAAWKLKYHKAVHNDLMFYDVNFNFTSISIVFLHRFYRKEILSIYKSKLKTSNQNLSEIVWLRKLESSRLKKTLNANLKSLIVFFIFIKINPITKKRKCWFNVCVGKISWEST